MRRLRRIRTTAASALVLVVGALVIGSLAPRTFVVADCVALALLAGLSHGYLRGIRWRDRRSCIGCNHELPPGADGRTRCPECGLAQDAAA
jgi:hypothetical protein